MIFVQQLFPHLVGLPHMKLDQVVDTNIEHKKEILNHLTKQLYKCTQTGNSCINGVKMFTSTLQQVSRPALLDTFQRKNFSHR